LIFSDIPEATDEQLKRMRRVGRSSTAMAKQLIAYVCPRVSWQACEKMAAKQGKPYQTFIHELPGKVPHHAA
jgi:predicted DNA binding CopG/RHH family protein